MVNTVGEDSISWRYDEEICHAVGESQEILVSCVLLLKAGTLSVSDPKVSSARKR